MDANTYQAEARRTLIDAPDREIPENELQAVWNVLQIAIKAGKLVEYMKKAVFHQHGLDYAFLVDTLLDISDSALSTSPMPDNLTPQQIMELWVTTGLVGEAAEVAEMLVNSLVSGEPVSSSEFSKELGDLGWYWASRATQRNLALNDILIGNVEKLQKRYQNGYSAEASKNRADV